MSDKSDGKKTGVRKKTLNNEERKPRSHSLGTIDFTEAQIKEIIGMSNINRDISIHKNLDKADSEVNINNQHKQPADSLANNKQNIELRGELNKNNKDLDTKTEQNNYNNTFTPKNSIARTPTKSTSDDAKTQKRPRSESSPSVSQDRQKIRKQTECDSENTNNDDDDTIQENKLHLPNTETTIEEILETLENIHILSEKENFDKNDLSEMRKSSFKLHKRVTSLVYKLGQLEKENILLYQEIRTKKTYIEPIDCSQKQVEPGKIPKTYSTVVKTNLSQSADSGNEHWKTPPKTRKHDMLIQSKNPGQTENVLKEVKKNLIGSNETVRSVRHLQSGGIIIECQNDDQRQRLQNILQKQDQLQIKEIQNTDPMLMITGIDIGYKPDNFINDFVEENPQIKTVFGPDVSTKFKFITKRQCRNNNKENWILQTAPEIFKWLIRNENLTFDLTRAYIQEYVSIALCFNCCNFGHLAKYCKGAVCCYKCGDSHEPNQCTTQVLDCPNCKRLKLNDRCHSARDSKCPAFIQKISKQREYINFNITKEQNNFL